ncbi:MAG: hypothetical protein HUU01_21160, partial [Saprospiraceae bacterium]|nr:hypothetical protein [Saprospiraceae bacterium]
MKNHLLLLLCCAATCFCFAQTEDIQFSNPSFEDFARASNPPINWYDCGFQGETPPDVQPDPTFNVTKEAYHGETYLGMVTRDNDTWESVSQQISLPLKKGGCYTFEVYLARSLTYMSISRISDKVANYATPTKLRVWGGFRHCDKKQLLAETRLVINTNWKPYRLFFEAIEAYSFLTFEAFYDTPTLIPYNGNLLLDNLSDIKAHPCNQDPGFDPELFAGSEKEETEVQIPETPAVTITEQELVNIAETIAPRINFNTFGSLNRSLHTDKNTGKEIWVNYPLYSLLEGLKQHPIATVILVITEKDPDLAEKKRKSLKIALRNMGARKDQVIVRNWLEKDEVNVW